MGRNASCVLVMFTGRPRCSTLDVEAPASGEIAVALRKELVDISTVEIRRIEERVGAMIVAVFGLAVCLALLTSCGDSSGGTNCTLAPHCGGDLVGSWAVTASCVETNATAPSTPGCQVPLAVRGSYSVTGTAVFNSDLTYNMALAGSGTSTVEFPLSCLTVGGITITCDQLSQHFAPDPTISSVKCTVIGGTTQTCECVSTLSGQPNPQAGTYSTSGSSLTTVPAGGAAEAETYCVRGNQLTISPSTADSMSSVAGNLTLFRQ